MSVELYEAGELIGHAVGSFGRVYGYAADGSPLGCFHSIDDVVAHIRRKRVA